MLKACLYTEYCKRQSYKLDRIINIVGNINKVIVPQRRASLVAQTVKRLSTMQETWVQSLDREDPLEKEGNGNPL